MVDFRLSEEQMMIRDMAREFCDEEVLPNAEAVSYTHLTLPTSALV